MSKDILQGGDFNKFVVIKNEDMDNYSTYSDINNIDMILLNIRSGRRKDNKALNNYIVINIDEEYAPEVIEILKRYKHWG